MGGQKVDIQVDGWMAKDHSAGAASTLCLPSQDPAWEPHLSGLGPAG